MCTTYIKGNNILILMHSCIVNGYQLPFDAHNVLEQNRCTAALFIFYSHSSFSPVSFCVFGTVLYIFLGVSVDCVLNIKRVANLVL